MLSGHSSYAPQLPETISVHPHFGSTRRFFVDGYVADVVDPKNLPTIQITDDLGRVGYRMVIDVVNQAATITSDWNSVRMKIKMPLAKFSSDMYFDSRNQK